MKLKPANGRRKCYVPPLSSGVNCKYKLNEPLKNVGILLFKEKAVIFNAADWNRASFWL
jgi:hypothetical protein